MSKEESATTTRADEIWNAIKGLELGMFALPNQTVENNCKRVPMLPDQVHLLPKSSAVMAVLAEAIKPVKVAKLNLEATWAGGYIVVQAVAPGP
jgi:hypothetical protein